MKSNKPVETSGNRGGHREGAGRKPSSHNRLAKEAIAKARDQGGLLPHEILLSIARGEPQVEHVVDAEGKVTKRWVSVDLEQRKDAAKAGAPYYAPKISTVEVITGVGDDELDAIIKGAAAAAGVSVSLDGEGEEAGPAPGQGSRPRVRLD